MNKDGKQPPKARVARKSPNALARFVPSWRVLLPLALGTFLLALGLFLAWQTSLVWRYGRDISQAESARTVTASAIASQIHEARMRVEHALTETRVQQALRQDDDAGRTAAAAALKPLLPGATDAQFFSPNLKEVLSGDLGLIGYAKAAALMEAKVNPDHPLAEMRVEKDSGQQLLLAVPAQVDRRVVAFAVVEWPFAPILETFNRTPVDNVRLDLRQGSGRGDSMVASIGSGGNTTSDLGVPIAGSILRIGEGAPNYFIVVQPDLALLVPMTLLCLLGGAIALWLRQIGLERTMGLLRRSSKPAGDEMTLAQTLQQSAATESAPAKSAAAAVAGDEEAVAVDPGIFRMYDIRGVVGKTLTPSVARQIGRAIGSEAREREVKEIVIGRDGRLSGPDMVAALIAGLRTTGIDVIDLGAVPTPVTYFACFQLNTGSGVSVTGSHNPPDYNGFKIVLGGDTLSGDAIHALYRRVEENRFAEGMGGLQTVEIDKDYIARITNDVQTERRLKVVIDCGNGIAGAIAPAVLEGIGCEVVPLYCDVDGTFPSHHPDPSDLDNLKDLILSVKKVGADLGLAFDGDGDRLGVVTASGEVIFPDRVLMLFAMDILTRDPGATIIYDVKCTGHLQSMILSHGGSPLMWRTGHSLIKAKMKETDAALAGEMSGHFFFAERWYGFDDAIYAAARLMEILAGDPEGRTPQEIFNALPKGVSTPELKIPMRESENYGFVEAFKEKAHFDGARLTTIDGLRADWPDGWGLVRASNTTPVLVLRFDADNEQALARIQQAFRTQLYAIDGALKLPF